MDMLDITTNTPIHFTPGIFVTVYDLERMPIPELMCKYETLRRKCKEVFDFMWDNNIMWVTDIYGNAYKLSLHLNNSGGGKVLDEVIVDVWSPREMLVFHGCFKFDKKGKVLREDWCKLKKAMDDYATGTFICAFCKSPGRLFGEGTGHSPTQHICATCNAKPEVQNDVARMFHNLSAGS